MVGDYDAKTRALTLFSSIIDNIGKQQKRKNIMIYRDKNYRDFIMLVRDGDKWVKSIEIRYERMAESECNMH